MRLQCHTLLMHAKKQNKKHFMHVENKWTNILSIDNAKAKLKPNLDHLFTDEAEAPM